MSGLVDAASRNENRSDNVVDVRNLTKTYRSWTLRGRATVHALRGVSLSAKSGEVFGLLGPNGAGKTTLIKILLGVVRSTAGSASLFGQSAGTSKARSRVGYLPESLRVDRHHSARSALRYYGRMSRMSSAEISRRSDELLELVGLASRDRESVRQFSKGMYQRLGLAQALMHDPDLLVLDEPTDGLDPVGRSEVRMVIDRLRDAGKTIFLNSHILQEVELICSRVAIMAAGKIQIEGPLDTLTSNKNFDEVAFEIVPCNDLRLNSTFLESLLEMFPQIKITRSSESQGAAGSATEPLHSDADPPSDECVRFTLPLSTQGEVDHAVDQIRHSGHSIRQLTVKRDSLEETFMRAVATAEVPIESF